MRAERKKREKGAELAEKSGALERSGERTFQKTPERQRSVER